MGTFTDPSSGRTYEIPDEYMDDLDTLRDLGASSTPPISTPNNSGVPGDPDGASTSASDPSATNEPPSAWDAWKKNVAGMSNYAGKAFYNAGREALSGYGDATQNIVGDYYGNTRGVIDNYEGRMNAADTRWRDDTQKTTDEYRKSRNAFGSVYDADSAQALTDYAAEMDNAINNFNAGYNNAFKAVDAGEAAAMNAVNQQVAGLGRGANEMGALGGHAFGGGAQAGQAQAALAGAGLQQRAIADYMNKRAGLHTDQGTGLAGIRSTKGKNLLDGGMLRADTMLGYGGDTANAVAGFGMDRATGSADIATTRALNSANFGMDRMNTGSGLGTDIAGTALEGGLNFATNLGDILGRHADRAGDAVDKDIDMAWDDYEWGRDKEADQARLKALIDSGVDLSGMVNL